MFLNFVRKLGLSGFLPESAAVELHKEIKRPKLTEAMRIGLEKVIPVRLTFLSDYTRTDSELEPSDAVFACLMGMAWVGLGRTWRDYVSDRNRGEGYRDVIARTFSVPEKVLNKAELDYMGKSHLIPIKNAALETIAELESQGY